MLAWPRVALLVVKQGWRATRVMAAFGGLVPGLVTHGSSVMLLAFVMFLMVAACGGRTTA